MVKEKRKVRIDDELYEEEEDVLPEEEDPDMDDLPEEDELYDVEEESYEEDSDEEDSDSEPDEDVDEEESWEDEDEVIRKPKEKGYKGILVIGIIGILILAAMGAAIVYTVTRGGDDDLKDDTDPFDNIGKDTISENRMKARFTEIMPHEDWFEIYVEGPAQGSIDGWTVTTFDEGLIELPEITGIDGFDHIVVHAGSGTGDHDCSDGRATVYLGLAGTFLDAGGDELALFDADDNIVDFVAWGEGNGDTPRLGWTKGDYLTLAPTGSSLSLQGPSVGPSSYWTAGPPSPGANNIVEVPLPGDWVIHIVNGRTEPYMAGYNEEYDIFDALTPPRDVNVSFQVPAAHPVGQNMMDNLTEYIDFTYKLLKEMGFGDPASSGTDPSGRPIIRVTASGNGSYSGVCMPDGSIQVDLGTNKVTNKKLVEHEVTHSFQWRQRQNGAWHIGPLMTRFLEEGMAEFVGRYSTMKNYNMTWAEVEKELQSSGNLNIINYTSKSHINIFTDWHGANNRTYYANIWEYYEIAFLFWKFLFDKFGKDVIKKIYDNTSYGGSGTNVIGVGAIEAATGQKLEDLIREFMLYRVENRFPQYQAGIDFGPVKPDREVHFTGAPSSASEWVERYGSRVNRFVMNGSGGIIEFNPRMPNSRWGITIIGVKPDGSRSYENHTLGKGQNGTFVIPPGMKEVIVIKTLLDGTVNYPYEFFNMTIRPNPVITPMGPDNDEHILWDPHPLNIWWVLENLTREMRLRLQIDNTSTFDHPFWDQELGWNVTEWPFPEDIGNGTWWWRLRWEKDDVFGPWTPYSNFTIWRGFDRPEIMWDPAPLRFENDTGSFLVVIPGMNVTIPGYDVPEGLNTGYGHAGFRLGGPYGSVHYNWSFGEAFPIGDLATEEHTYFEWRVNYPLFGDWPWFRDDILWDPASPEFEILAPVNGSRHRFDTNMSLRVDLNRTDGRWAVDSFFDVFFRIDTGVLHPYTGSVVPLIESGRYEIPINISELPQGVVRFYLNIRDAYGRIGDVHELWIEVDRTAPDLSLRIDPDRDPAYYNGPFRIVASTSDPNAVRVEFEITDGNATKFQYAVSDRIPNGTAYEFVLEIDPAEQGLAEGWANVRAIVRDDLGNSRTVWSMVAIDTIIPHIMVITPYPNMEVISGHDVHITVMLSEIAGEISSVYAVLEYFEGEEVGRVDLAAIDQYEWTGNIQMPMFAVPTTFVLTVYAVDLAGNVGWSGFSLQGVIP